MLGRFLLNILAVQFLSIGLCAAQSADPQPILAGDRWTYDIKDTLTGELRRTVTLVVAEINDKEIVTRITTRGKERTHTSFFGLDWGRIDDGTWKLRPAGIGIKQPLQIGKERKSESNAVNMQSGLTLRVSGTAKVVGQEQITTPAGTFDTFRIEMTVRMINVKDQTKSQTWTYVNWYALAVNRWVRRNAEWKFEGRVRDSYSEELTEYSRKP